MHAWINTYIRQKEKKKYYILDVTKETKHTRQHGFMLKYQNHNIYIFTNNIYVRIGWEEKHFMKNWFIFQKQKKTGSYKSFLMNTEEKRNYSN